MVLREGDLEFCTVRARGGMASLICPPWSETIRLTMERAEPCSFSGSPRTAACDEGIENLAGYFFRDAHAIVGHCQMDCLFFDPEGNIDGGSLRIIFQSISQKVFQEAPEQLRICPERDGDIGNIHVIRNPLFSISLYFSARKALMNSLSSRFFSSSR